MWKPIETAPTNGSWIVAARLTTHNSRKVVAYVCPDIGDGWMSNNGRWYSTDFFTHWCLFPTGTIPATPGTTAEKGEV